VPNEQFIVKAMTGDRTSVHCLTSHVGTGSDSHCLHAARRNDAATCSAVTAVPKVSSGVTSRGSTVGAPAVAVDRRIAEILLSKNDAKSLAENGLTTAPGGCSSTLSRRRRVFLSAPNISEIWTHNLFRRFLEFSQFSTTISRNLRRHLAIKMGNF